MTMPLGEWLLSCPTLWSRSALLLRALDLGMVTEADVSRAIAVDVRERTSSSAAPGWTTSYQADVAAYYALWRESRDQVRIDRGVAVLACAIGSEAGLVEIRGRATLRISQCLPHTLVDATPGRPIGSVIEHPLLTSNAFVIERASVDRRGATFWFTSPPAPTTMADEPVQSRFNPRSRSARGPVSHRSGTRRR